MNRKEQIKQQVLESMKSIGLPLECGAGEEMDLSAYIDDSITFASFVIELEDRLQIELPYEYLSEENLHSLEGFCGLIENLL